MTAAQSRQRAGWLVAALWVEMGTCAGLHLAGFVPWGLALMVILASWFGLVEMGPP